MLHADGNWTSDSSSTSNYDNSFTVSYDGIDEHVKWYMWVADSGSTVHIVKDKELFRDMAPIQKEIRGIGDQTITAHGIGTVQVQACVGNKASDITLHNVLYTPNAVHNLFSVTRLDREGGSSLSGGGEMKLFDTNNNLFAVAILQNGIYELRMRRHVPGTNGTGVSGT